MKWFWHTVDTGGVLCQIVFYPLFVAGGLLMLFTGAPTTVYQVLGPVAEAVWVATIATAPIVCLVGALLPSGVRDQYRDTAQYVSIVIQLGANVTLTAALMSYATAITQSAWLDKGAFSPWLALGIAILTVLITLRDARKLRGIEHLKQGR